MLKHTEELKISTMNNFESKPPLWQVLFNSGNPPCPVEEMLAAEILAFCDWLLPAENSPDLPHRDDPIAWKLWQERQRLRSILMEEASKAQKQEV